MKLNLGSGQDYKHGYINIDAVADTHPDMVADICSPLPFADSSIEEIIASDVLEHLIVSDQQQVLSECWRVLAPGGTLYCRIPNIDQIVTQFSSDPQVRNVFLYGDTSKTGQWGAHKSGHTVESFLALGIQAGFTPKQIKMPDTNFDIYFTKSSPPHVSSVLFLNQTLGIGGAETVNQQLLNWLATQGVAVKAYTTNSRFLPQAKKIHTVLDLLGNKRGLGKALLLAPVGIAEYAWLLWRHRHADVLLMTGYIEKIIATPIAKLLDIPVVWIEYGPVQHVFSKFFSLPKYLYKLVKNLPEVIIVPSIHTRNSLVNYLQVSIANIVVIPCARDIDAQHYVGIPQKKNQVVCVSRLEKGKGQDALIRAWPYVLKAVPKAILQIVGTGDQAEPLKHVARQLGVDRSVYMTGWVQDPLIEVAASVCAVFPSVWPLEGFGVVQLEAMALAKPVITRNAPPANEVVDESCARFVPENDPIALATAIVGLLKNPAAAHQLGQSGREKYTQQYTFATRGPQILNQLLSAIAKQKALKYSAALCSQP